MLLGESAFVGLDDLNPALNPGFSASERWQEGGSEREFYSDASGKSGGQKEKLAYTVLASALAYQFGLEWGVVQSRSFRFVIIDSLTCPSGRESRRKVDDGV
jgi:uncharacterized protein YPO0396